MTDTLTPPLAGQIYEAIPNIDDYLPESEQHNTARRRTTYLEEATVTTSRVAGSNRHKVVLDLDLPAKLVPSTTEGHHHLYVDHEMSWEAYVRLLDALVEAGLVERGFVAASKSRGHTAARLPWIRKETREGAV